MSRETEDRSAGPKVLLVHNHYQLAGGEDVVFRSESSLLRERGHRVVEYVADNREVETASPLRVAAETIWSRQSHRRLGALLDRERPDVAHFHNTFVRVSPSAYRACRERGIPVVQTLHNYRLFCPAATFYRRGQVCEACMGRTPPWPAVVHGCYRGSRAASAVVAALLTVHRALGSYQHDVSLYVALNDFVRRKAIEGGLPSRKVVVKSNFVHPDPLARKGGGDYALYAGRLSAEKGIETLLAAWEERGLRIPLRIVGEGPLASRVAAVSDRLAGVEWLGRRGHSELIALMKGAAFLVVPSVWYENMPMVVLEAYAVGLPVLASRLGALAELVVAGRTGSHFEPGDAADLARCAARLASDRKLREGLGRGAREEFERRYTAERSYDRLLQIYEQALSMGG